MEVSDARKLKALEEENRRLKHLVADLTLDVQMLKAVNEKNGDPRRTPPGCGLPPGGLRYQ